MLNEFQNNIDWKELINSRYNDEIFGMSFLKEFEDRIPASSLKDSRLWGKIVEEKEKQIRAEIILG